LKNIKRPHHPLGNISNNPEEITRMDFDENLETKKE
jgi:hypothetical protein